MEHLKTVALVLVALIAYDAFVKAAVIKKA